VTSVDQLKDHIRVLTEFEHDYRRYIEAQEAEDAGHEPDLSEPERAKLRRDLLRRVDAAERAMRQADKMPRVEASAWLGGHALTGLSDQVFAHETPLFGSGEPWLALPNGLLDTMCAALGTLENQLKEAQRSAQERAEAEAHMSRVSEDLMEDFAKNLEARRHSPTGRSRKQQKPPKAGAEGTPWYHNPWVVTIGGTVVGGAILVLLFGS
jgi:hypothetical protein